MRLRWRGKGRARPEPGGGRGQRPPVPRRYHVLARLIGFGLPMFALVSAIALGSQCTSYFASVQVPGSGQVALGPGEYSVFYEYPERMPWNVTPEVGFVLRTLAGLDVVLQPAPRSAGFSAGTRSYAVLYDFTLREAGIYELVAWFTGTPSQRRIEIGIGRGPGQRWTLTAIGVAVVIVSIGACMGLLFLLVRHVRRHYDTTRRG
jgi:hypothetical protein